MHQLIRQHHIVTYAISLGFLTSLLSLFQPIHSASAQPLTGPVSQETSGASIQGQRIETIATPLPSPRKPLEKKDSQTTTRKSHRLIRKPQNSPVASVESSPPASSPDMSLPRSLPSLQNDNATSQSTELSSLNGSVGAAVPLASTSVAPSSARVTGPTTAAALPTTGTIPLAAAGAGNSSNSRSRDAGGRSMGRLAAEMPGLAQLNSPPSVPVLSAPPVNSPPSVPVVSAPPAIGASPTHLAFVATRGGANPATQTVSISNRGGGTLTWSTSDNAAWLTASPASGTGSGTVTVSVVTGSLATGTYSSMITLGATGATAVSVPVTFTVAAAPVPPAIGTSPTSLTFVATLGGANPATQTVSISNSGGGTLTWSTSDNAAWLTASPASGTGNGTLTASVNTTGLAIGTYTGTITVAASGATSRTVSAVLTVSAPASSSVTLIWNTNTESNLAGYKVYRATASGAYGAPIATLTGNITTYTAVGLEVGTTYFFVVTAYDDAGKESSVSNEVNKRIL